MLTLLLNLSLQAENHESMMSWITAIKENSNPDDDVSGNVELLFVLYCFG